MQVQILLALLVQDSFGLRINPKDTIIEMDHTEEDMDKMSVLNTVFSKLPDGKMALDHLFSKSSGLKVVHTQPDGNHDMLEVFLTPKSIMSLQKDFDNEDLGSGRRRKSQNEVGDLPGGFKYSTRRGTFKKGLTRFMELLLQDLDENKLSKLQDCGTTIESNPNSRGGSGVWLVLNGEKLSAEQLENNKAFQNNNVLILGAPGRDVAAGKGRSIYVPGASLAFMSMEQTPMGFVNRTAKKKDRELAHQHTNCKKNREATFEEMCAGLAKADMSCYALGPCGHNKYAKVDNDNNEGGRGILNRDDRSTERFSRYKFVEAFENSAGIPSTPSYSSSGYITEKITPVLLAGAVPIYAGADNVTEVFNADALIQADPHNLEGAIQQMISLEQDPSKYKKMVTQDAVTAEQMKKFFTWHPATHATHGDHLRARIVDQILEFCESM